jgi:hypothetical protein
MSQSKLDTTTLLNILRAHRTDLVDRYHIKSLSLFGSYVRDEQTATSDVDVLVEFDIVPSLFEFIRREQHLSELLGAPVDLVMKDTLKPRIGRRILQELVPV